MNKTIGCILIATGAAIGGGTIALPIVVAGMGFPVAAALLIAIATLSCAAGLLTLEVNLAFKAPHNTFATMAEASLGKAGKGIIYVLWVIFLYAMISAYISGGASLVHAGAQLLFGDSFPQLINTTVYTIVLGGVVAYGARAVDLLNRGLFTIKTGLILVLFIAFLPQVNVAQLMSEHHWIYAGAGIPVIMCAFGSHIVIPSITEYMGHDIKKLRLIILCSNVIPLAVYLVWIACLLGTIPYGGENSLISIAGSSTKVETLMFVISANMKSHVMVVVINLFSHVVIVTSFLGCSLSMFDFIRDRKNHEMTPSRVRTAMLTFAPPLVIGLIYPDALVQLLGYASILVAIMLIILPAVMAWRMRKRMSMVSPYRMAGGSSMILIVAILGCALIGAEIFRMTGYFIVWTG